MLEYSKMILSKVSFDKMLFKKELSKSLKNLNSDEVIVLQNWLYSNYNNQHNEILEDFFEYQVA